MKKLRQVQGGALTHRLISFWNQSSVKDLVSMNQSTAQPTALLVPWEWEAVLCRSSSFILIFQAWSSLIFHTLEEKMLDGWPRGLCLSFLNSSGKEGFDFTQFSFSLYVPECFPHHPIIPCDWPFHFQLSSTPYELKKNLELQCLELKQKQCLSRPSLLFDEDSLIEHLEKWSDLHSVTWLLIGQGWP